MSTSHYECKLLKQMSDTCAITEHTMSCIYFPHTPESRPPPAYSTCTCGTATVF